MSLNPFQREVLVCLYWHRLMSTAQVRRLVAPAKPMRTVRHRLQALREAGLIDCVHRHHAPRTWYTTGEGAAEVEASGAVDTRPYRIASTITAQLLGNHAVDVVDTGLVFVETAREHGHDCGPLSWTPEVAHRYRAPLPARGARRDVVEADAVLHYVIVNADRQAQYTFFIELDRATMPVARLAQKLVSYVLYYSYRPGKPGAPGRPSWQERYPRFPRVLVVLSGAAEPALERRLADLRVRAQAMATVALAEDRVCMLVTTLERLRGEGPFAEIAVPLLGSRSAPVSVFSWPKGEAA